MKTLKIIAIQLKRVADSMMMIEITLLKINEIKYSDLKRYATDYDETAKSVSEILEGKEENK